MDNQTSDGSDNAPPDSGLAAVEAQPAHEVLQGFQMSQESQLPAEEEKPFQSPVAVNSIYPNAGKEHSEPSNPSWSAPISPNTEPSTENIKRGPNLSMQAPADDRPVPVVKVLSVRGVEYAMMSILLWFGAGSLMTLLVSLIQGGAGFESLAFPLSLLLVCLPGFAFFYLRLRSAELANPDLRLDASKRRFSQITQILAFLTCFFNIVAVVYLLVGMAGGNEAPNIGKVLGSAVVILLVAGGILYYYWVDEHKLVGNK